MRLRNGFALRQVADTWMVLPPRDTILDFNGMLTLNETGALFWRALEKGSDRETLADVLVAEYAIDRQQALNDVDEFLQKLEAAGCAE